MTRERPTRATTAGRAYLDLQNLARRQRRPTDELQQLYALEGFLARLTSSAYAGALVLKGGVLLAAYDARRPTRDIDVQAPGMAGEPTEILGIVREIAAIGADDGLVFHPDTATAEIIRDEDAYSGVRVAMAAALPPARLSLHIDVNVGDPIVPAPQILEVPRILGGTISLPGYPLPMVFAEKIVTALQRGTVNTRWRDFADIYLLAGRHPVGHAELRRALTTVAGYRQVELSPLRVALVRYAEIAQPRWFAWRRKQHLEDRLPSSFADVVDDVTRFADPATTIDDGAERRWDPRTRRWT